MSELFSTINVFTILAATTLALPAVDELISSTAAWAEAAFSAKSGAVAPGFVPAARPPFSLLADGKPVVLDAWTRHAEGSDRRWTDAASGLSVAATVTAWPDFPAVEWMLRLRNDGKVDSPLLSDVQALDVVLPAITTKPLTLLRITGDSCSFRSFTPADQELAPGGSLTLAPVGGRSSNGTLPFFAVQQGDTGWFIAIGWSGQWQARIERDVAGALRLRAGLERMALRLHPGETVRTPRILLMRWSGDAEAARNRFRQLLLAHYSPKIDGQTPMPALGAQMFNSFANGKHTEWGTEAGQIAAAELNHKIGADTLWMDAGWFSESGWSKGVGTWRARPKDFPKGLAPVGEASHRLGLRWLVWFEPERVYSGTEIDKEHPAFLLGSGNHRLFNLGDEQARAWMLALMCQQITASGIDTWRCDFNIDPLPYWRANDQPGRDGITEIRYIEGLYSMWDGLRARFPHLVLDNCASGGRRIDIELLSRALVQTRSDTACVPGRSEWDQSQVLGIHQWIPNQATIGWEVSPYAIRSSATSGYCGEWDFINPAFPVDLAKLCFAEVRANRPYWYGDMHPLTPSSITHDRWMAWQLHRPKEGDGIILAFRRQQAAEPSLRVQLRQIDPAARYAVTFIDEALAETARALTGAELMALELSIPSQRASLLVRYRREN
ncbi:MAG: alpha-galactosidase [Planctomycetota bacterium]